jgi:hypothetical protein
LWNKSVSPEWARTAGVWQPCQLFVTPTFKYFHAAATIFPGAIGYLSYELEQNARVAQVVVLSVLSTLFTQRLFAQLRRLGQKYIEAEEAFALFLAAWACILVLCIVLVFALIELLAAATVTSAATALAELAAAVGAILNRFFPSPA